MQTFSKKKTLPKASRKIDNDVVFLKPVPVHPRDRLTRETKHDVKLVTITLDHYNNLSKKSKNENVTFIKQVLRDP